ncbi:hypothetical protein C8J55DRAFT_556144 [Lentinula edodes]|uniref:Uncharacterized protein n=1 Tax=Lentinula lateritia TaxID=40482 RepID=A0A9W9AZ17_9AGAR|nr:hypothetical protein C8J55DRAFT_556144 [Lentinula edodes]
MPTYTKPSWELPSPVKATPRPFPLSVLEMDNDNDPPATPRSAQRPSSQRMTRDANALVSAELSDSFNDARKGKYGLLNKSPRKSRDHEYPKMPTYANRVDSDRGYKTRHKHTLQAAFWKPQRANASGSSAMSKTAACADILSSPSPFTCTPRSISHPTSDVIIISDSEEELSQYHVRGQS